MAVVRLASRYGRYGYRRVTAMLQWEGWRVNHKRVERIWRREGLKVPAKQPKRGRLWLTDGSCVRLRPQRRNHVWAYDFVALRTSDGKPVRLLTVVDEYTRECLAIHVGRSLRSPHVIECLGDLMVQRGVPEHLRSDNGPEFTARAVRLWLQGVGATTLFITPGSPWENGYVAVQDKCPSNCSAEMSPVWSAIVSDGDTVDATGDRRVGGFSASTYLLTVSLWIPNSLAIRRMDIPLSFACCTAFHLSCCRKVGFRGDATTCNPATSGSSIAAA